MNESDRLEALIDEALRPSRRLPVPNGFLRRTEQRLRIAALAVAERRRFRICVFTGVSTAVGLCLALLGALWAGGAERIVLNIPGVLGLWDQAGSVLVVWWPGLLGVFTIGLFAAGLSTLLAETRRVTLS